ncbi:DUF433 domain-containing protein [Novosphingobium sp.]|jgi:uncharacterized protein (DUF433 family)|uniref:DUF433 domain-containing protein n=1 Tax=Novosphingobium sp. TaxID=1874826 RepID=UPI001EB6E551|nr:DUF433 domain-containing protein [Novosphingobium sp.]MBK9011899.1 DUF433 domain-containing protein [Novosphingobium sp.]MCC6479366.1 DUF433 domain-containing protein [Sphingomonadaceae bacterium]
MPTEFSAREVAELANVPVRAVDKAIEEKVLTGIRTVARGRRRMLPLHAVPYAAIIARLPVTLSLSAKRDLARTLCKRSAARMTVEPLEIAPAVMVDVSALVGPDMADRAARYGKARDSHIEINPDIMGGTPVLRGTRMTVYSVKGRLDGGDSIDDILEDNPHLTREAVETAALYARTHPIVGRPGGRPWAKAA